MKNKADSYQYHKAVRQNSPNMVPIFVELRFSFEFKIGGCPSMK